MREVHIMNNQGSSTSRYVFLPIWRIVSLCLLFCLVLPATQTSMDQVSADELMKSGQASLQARNYVEARRFYSAALQQFGATRVTDARLVRSLTALGLTCRIEGLCVESSAYYVRAIRALETTPGADALELAKIWQFLASAYDCQSLFSRARQALERAVDLKQSKLGERNPDMIELLANLAMAYNKQKSFVAAETVAKRAWDIVQENSAVDPTLATLVLTNLGTIFGSMRRYEEAEVALREGVAILERSSNSRGEQMILLLNNLALTCASQKRNHEATNLLARAVDLLEQGAPMEPRDTAQVLKNYAGCLRRIGNKTVARKFEVRAGVMLSALPSQATGALVIDANDLLKKY
jgi:tetratricopeptide (TPR) repeat protein